MESVLLTLALSAVIIMQLVHHIYIVKDLQFLCSQLKEMEDGSQIELCVQSRQRHVLELCRQLNDLLRLQRHRHMQYEKMQQHLKQNIGGLAHDIRTPLTGAAGYVQLAQECGQPSRQQHYLKTALERMKELEDMLEELFLYTKLTSEDFEPSISKIQVLPLLSDCLIGMYSQFEQKGMLPDVRFSSESFCVQADEECLRRIFHNLIRNALIHGTGTLAICQAGSCITFENTVAEADRPDPDQIFDRFYKADTARRKGSSGLGLFIVKELAQKMDANVWAQVQGEKFCVSLNFSDARTL